MTRVKVRPGESPEKTLRTLKKKVDKEGILKTTKAKRFHLKPSIKKRAKQKLAKKYNRKRKETAF